MPRVSRMLREELREEVREEVNFNAFLPVLALNMVLHVATLRSVPFFFFPDPCR